MSTRVTRAPLLLVLISGFLVGCGSDEEDFRRELDDGFDTGVGVDVDADAERNLAGALSSFHIPQAGIDCMVAAAMASPPPVQGGEQPLYYWEAADLDELAAQCDVDVSELWYMTD